MFQDVHRRKIAAALAATLLTVLPTPAPAALARVEVGSTEVSGGVVVGSVPFAVAACFAVGQKGLVGRNVNTNPDLAKHSVHPFNVSSELMFTVEAVGLIIAQSAVGLGTGWSLD